MRKILGSAIAVTALVGCASPDSVALEHRSELAAQTRGVQLGEDGRVSNVGMLDTTCSVTTEFAMMSDDFDYPTDEETVVDASTTPDGISAVVITPGQVNLTTPDQFPWTSSFEVIGVIDARKTDDGFVATSVPPTAGVDCDLTWFDAAGQQVASAASLGIECDGESDMTTDPVTGTSWVSTDTGVVRVTQTGDVLAVDDTPNARLSWDEDSDALYLGALGTDTVRALELDGALRWEVAVDGSITALSHMGEESSAAVSIESPLGGELIVIDGLTGEVQADLPTPSSAQALDVSGDGRVMAVTLPNSVHYFDVLSSQ